MPTRQRRGDSDPRPRQIPSSLRARRLGMALEALYASSLDDHLAELAHHYGRSANPAKACEFLHSAGDQAVGRASYAEAESYFAAALEVLAAMLESPERDAGEL